LSPVLLLKYHSLAADILIQTNAPFFETVIRYLGGLLSAYALSGESILLARADELGRQLLPVFNSPSGLPHFSVNVET
jgi:mannosyl-oligosaccharide alpha-1,2-mannosidase